MDPRHLDPPLTARLGIRDGTTVAVLHAPEGLDDFFGGLPPGAVVQHGLRKSDRVDVVLGFVTERAHVERNIDWLLTTVVPGGSFWLATPTETSGLATDLDRTVLRALAAPRGWVDGPSCAVDDSWEAVQLVPADGSGEPSTDGSATQG